MSHPDALARLAANREQQAELRHRLSELATEHVELMQLATLPAPPALSEFPTGLLELILLRATDHDDLLRHAGACACVCSDWHRIVRSSSAYGFGWVAGARTRLSLVGGWTERARVLKVVSNALRTARGLPADSQDEYGKLSLADVKIGDNGGRAFGAALKALSSPLVLKEIDLGSNRLTAVGIAPIKEALGTRGFAGEGLKQLNLKQNCLGDVGLTLVVDAMPPSLEHLAICETGCGDEAILAVAARLSTLIYLRILCCSGNSAVTQVGWMALGAALCNCKSICYFDASHNTGVDDDAAAAIVNGTLPPNAAKSAVVLLRSCKIGDHGAQTIVTTLKYRVQAPEKFVIVVLKDNSLSSTEKAAIADDVEVRDFVIA